MASPGIGSLPHMAGELFKYMTGIDMAHVAYRSSRACDSPISFGGQVQVYFAPHFGSPWSTSGAGKLAGARG